MQIRLLYLTVVLGYLTSSASAIDFNVALDSSQSVPAPSLGGSTPSGSATVAVNTITGDISIAGDYTGMTSNVAASHLHGLAGAGETAGVIFGFNVTGGDSGTFTGSSTLDPGNLAGLLSGQTYINVHTANNGSGEIRAQVVDSDVLVFNLNAGPNQELPAPTLNGATPSGQATVVVDTSTGAIEVSGTYSGMTSNVAAAHLHGLAGPDSTASVIFGFDVTGGTDGSFSGSSILSSDHLNGLLSGQTYINIHTAQNGPGEIRAQVPEPSSAALLLIGLAMCTRFVQSQRKSKSH